MATFRPDVAHAPGGRADRARRGAPAQHQQLGVAVGVVDLERADVGRDPGDLRRADRGHALVVVRVVADVARAVLALEATDPVLAGPACPGSPTGARAARPARTGRNVPPFAAANFGSIVGSASTSGSRHGSEEFCRKLSDSRITGVRYWIGDPRGLDRHVEAIGGRRGGDDRDRRLAVAAEHRRQQVALLRLGRHAGRRAGAHHVDDDHRQLGDHGQTDRLGLQVHARDRSCPSRRGGRRTTAPSAMFAAAISSSACIVRTPKFLCLRQLVQQLGRRRDRVAGVEQRQPAALGGRDQAPGERLRAGDVAVDARARPAPPSRGPGARTARSSRRSCSRR